MGRELENCREVEPHKYGAIEGKRVVDEEA